RLALDRLALTPDAAVQRLPAARAELHPAELEELAGREVRRDRLEKLVAGERQVEERAHARELPGDRLQDLLLALGPRGVALARVEPVDADSRVDQRTLAVHVLLALPEPPALPRRALRGRVGAVEPVGEDRLLDVDRDPAELVD